MKKINLGILAHVDAGKTSLSEAFLFFSGVIRNQGRVDNANTFMDTDIQEKERGITIFSKTAIFKHLDTEFTIIDTPGHTDFVSELERSIKVLDYAVVVVSALDGIQTHTKTILKLLEFYSIPYFIFANKMDIAYDDQDTIFNNLNKIISNTVDLSKEDYQERVAMNDEPTLERYLNGDDISDAIPSLIKDRKIVPVYFGSALKNQGIEELLNALDRYTIASSYPEELSFIVYKITHEQGLRLVHIKMLGGSLKNKTVLDNEDKIDQIRVYSGDKFKTVDICYAGDVVVLKGPLKLMNGEVYGKDTVFDPSIKAFLTYRIILEKGVDSFNFYRQVSEIEEEDPNLHLIYDNDTKELSIEMMGAVQIEIITRLIKDRFGFNISLKEPKVEYAETITHKIEGVGHFEPIRHYAEVHLLVEPLPRGSGKQIDTAATVDVINSYYQRMILNYLERRDFKGVLTGSRITDLKITLLGGKFHNKHTEPSDVKEATKRALRQALALNESIILEPYSEYTLTFDNAYLSKVLFDLESLNSTHTIESGDTQTIIKGRMPAYNLNKYQLDYLSSTRSTGFIESSLIGYLETNRSKEIIEERNYDFRSDIYNSPDSVFFENGTSIIVPYDEVEERMHIPYIYSDEPVRDEFATYNRYSISEEELRSVTSKLFVERKPIIEKKEIGEKEDKQYVSKSLKKIGKILIIDGYNVLYSRRENIDNKSNFEYEKEKLIEEMVNFAGYYQGEVYLIFDAYKTDENATREIKNAKLNIVYTKKDQTADSYIEKFVYDHKNKYTIEVVSSDSLIQNSVIASGALRIPTSSFIRKLNDIKTKQVKRNDKVSANRPLAELKDLFKEG